MASSSEKKPRPEPTKKPSVLEIHLSTRACIILGVLLLIPHFILVIFALGRGLGNSEARIPRLPASSGDPAASSSYALCQPGPWGKLEYVRMSIEIPDEYVSAHLHETASSRWFFKSYSADKQIGR